jgi:hypothetical protein
VCLQEGSEQSLWEEETADPVCSWRILETFLKECHTIFEIGMPGSQRLHGLVAVLGPYFGDVIILQRHRHLVQV